MKSRWIEPLAIAGVTLLLGLATLELGVRLIEPKKVLREDFERSDPVFHHRFIPGSSGSHKALEFHVNYTINALGLRDRELTREKPQGTRRLLLLGDSFTEGNGVEAKDSFPARLQGLVDKAGLPARWEVINAGEGSYSPILHYLLLKKHLIDLEPDLVVLNLDLSDFHDDVQYAKLATFDASGEPLAVRAETPRPPGSWFVESAYALKDWLKEHTRSWNFLRRHLIVFLSERPKPSADIREDKYAMLRDGYSFAGGRDLEPTFRHIVRIRDLLAARGTPLWLSVYPYGNQVSPREWDKGRGFWGFEQNRLYSAEPQKQIALYSQRHAIPVIDMTERFRERTKTEFPLYFPFDGHFNPKGNTVAAEALFERLLPVLREAKTN